MTEEALLELTKKKNTSSPNDRIKELYARLSTQQRDFLGLQLSQALDFSSLAPFLNIHLNNLGDPFVSNCATLNTREMECEVLDHFAGLWHAPGRVPLDPDSYWGFLLTMGATEGNLYALWNARDYLAGDPLMHGGSCEKNRVPVLFYSEDTHYSITKCTRLLQLETFHKLGNGLYPGLCPITKDGRWPDGIPSCDGSIDPKHLAALVGFFVARGYPPIVFLNVGTSFKGAYDDVESVWRALLPVFERHGLRIRATENERQDYWVHIDGALGAGYLPHLEKAKALGLTEERVPIFDFRLPYVSSIVTSAHKWFGAPFPSGVFMTREKYRLNPCAQAQYVVTPDSTLASSRNGLSALILWYAINNSVGDTPARVASRCALLADYATRRLEKIREWHPGFWVKRASASLAVRFPTPRSEIFERFGLSADGGASHIFIMPHVTRSMVDALAEALSAPNAFEGCV